MKVNLNQFSKMYSASKALYIERKSKVCFKKEDKEGDIIKACNRVFYIIQNPDLDDEIAEATSDEIKMVEAYLGEKTL